MQTKARVLFLCVGNACRSQIAEGVLRHLADDRFEVRSAGAVPAGLSSRAVKVMAEIGVDISDQVSQSVDDYSDQTFDYVITVCDEAGNNPCPVFVGQAGKKLHWPFDDPAFATGNDEQVLAVFRRVRDEIKARLEAFVAEKSPRH
jgi:arsenate reductase